MSELYQDPNWPRAGAWLRGEHDDPALGRIKLFGAPAHLGSITPGRCDLAPAAIREALDRFSTFDIDDSVNVRQLALEDAGDLEIAECSPEEAFDTVRDAVSKAVPECDAVVLLGGDNSITYPGAMGLSDCGLITFDAHLDLRDTGGGLNNGNPIRALLSRGMPGDRIVQIGIQPFVNSAAYLKVAMDAGIRVVGISQVRERGIERVVQDALESFTEGYVYVDLDLDVLDRAYAPGAPGSRPGGLMPWELQVAARMCGEFARVRAFDLVEIDPERDTGGQTALSAASCLLSFASGVHRRCSRLSVARNL